MDLGPNKYTSRIEVPSSTPVSQQRAKQGQFDKMKQVLSGKILFFHDFWKKLSGRYSKVMEEWRCLQLGG